LQQNHEYDPIDKTVDVLKVASKGKYLDVLERLYIYKTDKCKQILIEQYVGESSVRFDLAIDWEKTEKKQRMFVILCGNRLYTVATIANISAPPSTAPLACTSEVAAALLCQYESETATQSRDEFHIFREGCTCISMVVTSCHGCGAAGV